MSTADPDSADPDDDALSWAGDELRGGIDPLDRNRVRTSPLDDASVDETDAAPATPTSLARSAATALFAVLYLGIVVGWILSAQLSNGASSDLFSQIAAQFGEFVAIISGALWFLAVLTLTPESRLRVRLGWFALGVGVLVPWPILLQVVA